MTALLQWKFAHMKVAQSIRRRFRRIPTLALLCCVIMVTSVVLLLGCGITSIVAWNAICPETRGSAIVSPDGTLRAYAHNRDCGGATVGSLTGVHIGETPDRWYVPERWETDGVFSFSGAPSDIKLEWQSNTELLIRYRVYMVDGERFVQIYWHQELWREVRLTYEEVIVEVHD